MTRSYRRTNLDRHLPLGVLGIFLLSSLVYPAAQPANEPRLVVIVAVDQGRAEYLDRFAPAFTGGLARLMNHGVIFTDAHQDHAVTATGPGHATIGTGAFPSRSGIVGNQWSEDDGRRSVYCVADPDSIPVTSLGKGRGTGSSPRNLKVSGFADWLEAARPGAKTVSASRKDRAAVLMGGQHPDAAYWYEASTGDFVSSTWYMERLPAWVLQFNGRKLPGQHFGNLWEPVQGLPDPPAMGLLPAERGWFIRNFPYALGGASLGPNPDFFAAFGETPLMDEYLIEFGMAAVHGEELGKDETPDLLALSLSAMDSVGHSFGPHSFEILDEFLRIDRALGRFFDFLDTTVGQDLYWVVFTGDHGAMDLPEYRQATSQYGGRLGAKDIQCIQREGLEFLERYGAEEDWFLSGWYLNYAAVGRSNRLRQEVERDAARRLEECDFIRKVWTRTELEGPYEGDPELGDFHRLFRNSFMAGRSPDLLVQTRENFLTSQGTGTSHGTPYRYDTHVPLIFLGPGLSAKRLDGRVATVDIAPTMADLLGFPVPVEVDGQSLVGRIR